LTLRVARAARADPVCGGAVKVVVVVGAAVVVVVVAVVVVVVGAVVVVVVVARVVVVFELDELRDEQAADTAAKVTRRLAIASERRCSISDLRSVIWSGPTVLFG